MRLGIKILAGFLTLSAMLAIAGLWSISQMNWMGENVEKILSNNYKSITAAKEMIKALEREDSAVLLIINGESQKYQEILVPADSSFNANFSIAEANITIPGESEIIEGIKQDYEKLSLSFNTLKNENVNKEWYFNKIHNTMMRIINDSETLLGMNDEKLYQTAQSITDNAERAFMPGVIAIIAAIVFSFIFSYLINYYLIKPIKDITSEVNKFIKVKKNFEYEAETNDEIYELANSVRLLAARATDIDNQS